MLPRATGKILIGNIATSAIEIRDIIKAWIAVSIAFGILLNGGEVFSSSFLVSFTIAALTVGIGFLLHELAHKIIAQRYGCFAEFRSFDSLLILAIILSLFTPFVFAAPGAVMIFGPVGVRRNGMISVAGPLTNIALALTFLSLLFLSGGGWLSAFLYYGLYINAFLALFNMLPFLNFDGAKVWSWNRGVYFAVVGVAGALMLTLQYVRPQ
jgi:Zn-dependent protease